MIANINAKTEVASKQEVDATEMKNFLEEKNKEITIKKAEADLALEEAGPIVAEA